MGLVVVVLIVLAVIVIGLIASFNGLVRKRNRTQEAWSQIDVQLKRRHDLIPNLVETVKGYAAHERGTFEQVTNARAAAVSAGATGDPSKVGPAENALTGALRSLFAVAESYPDLKASQNFRDLQEQITGTEDKIAFARQFYNTSVRDYLTAMQTFPRNLYANAFGFKPVPYLETEEADKEVPKVDFS
jgi:LemA protein